MISKWLKRGLVIAVVAFLAGGLFFGQDMVSYLRSSARSVQSAVKENVPIEFELRRARDTLEEIIPEMHANIRLIAQEEVEIANIKADITQSEESLSDEKAGVAKLRNSLDIHAASYTFGSHNYSREQVKDELSRRFERFKEVLIALDPDATDKAQQMAGWFGDRARVVFLPVKPDDFFTTENGTPDDFRLYMRLARRVH